jgi:hypothetical protein
MSVAAMFSERITARTAQRQLGPFLTQEYLRLMRSRTAMLIWAMMSYALLALPFIMQNPPPELVHAMATWLGSDDIRAKLFLFMWVDASWTVCLIGLVNLLILQARDTYSALLIAFIPAIASMFPGMIYIYRPDVFAGVPAVRDVVVFPMNLMWYPEVAIHWGLPVAALLLCLAIAFAALAGWSIERRDVR